VTFNITSHKSGNDIPVNDPTESYISYDRYDGSPGGHDLIDLLRLDVIPDRTPFTPPDPPTDLNASSNESAITLFWSPPVRDGGAPVIGFNVYRGNASMRETKYIHLDTSSVGFLDRTIMPGVTYYYRMTALNVIGEGLPGNEVNATVALPVPEDPNATHSIRISVRDGETYERIMSASIVVNPGARFALTDVFGEREITEFGRGKYSITVSAEGYEPLTTDVTVSASDAEVCFYLAKEVEGGAGGYDPQVNPQPIVFVLSSVLALELMLYVWLRKEEGGSTWAR
jgi:hypothetical protein